MTRIHAYCIKRARERFDTICQLYGAKHPALSHVEDLVQRALSDEIITEIEANDILEFAESGELYRTATIDD